MQLFFRYITPITYWILVVIWAYIFIFYLRKINRKQHNDKLLMLLLLILAIDAFRTLFESIYFGAWYTSLSGLIPIEIFNYLAQPQIVFFPKIFNLIAACLILALLIKKWLPAEIKQKEKVNTQIDKQLAELRETNERLLVAKEIAEQRASELSHQQLLFETMFNTINEGVVITNTQREILLANKGIETTFGYKPAEVIGQLTQIFYADDQKFEQAGTNVFNKNSQTPEKQYITYYKNKNNKSFPGETFGAKLFDGTGEWIGNLGIMRDISERINFINDIQEAKARAEESDKLKTAFLQNMSHEIRTPLNAICGFSGMLSKPSLSDEKRKSFVSIIQNSSAQLLAIVSDILTISSLDTKQEKLNIEVVCVNNILVDLLAIFRQQAVNQNVSIYTKQQLTNEYSQIHTDKTKLTQILTNLITNALKFTYEGSVEFGYQLKDNNLEFYVQDTGIGIEEALHEKIFERFRQADFSINKKYGGTGLGLSISRGFAELLGGRIWVESEPLKGATFYFTLPYKPAVEVANAGLHQREIENYRTVLVAEDDEYNFLFIEEILIELKLTLIHAKNGHEAVAFCKSRPDIVLVFMDIKMPGLDGHTAAKQIKELRPALPIVAQSAYALEYEREQYNDVFDDYLIKPLEVDLLLNVTGKYIKIEK